MKHVLKWVLYPFFALGILVLALIVPVGYVEFFCKGEGKPQSYQALIPESHHRLESRTLMTFPEWYIVHAYEDYAKVIRTGDPHDFGFVQSISGFWSSLCSLSKAASALGEVDTATKRMVYVIGVSFTAELGLKALYEETIGRIFILFRGDELSSLDTLSAEHARNYATFLQQVPWYKWRFREDAVELKSHKGLTLRDKERKFALGLEYSIKAAYADLIAEAVAATGVDQLTLRMILKLNDRSRIDVYPNIKLIEQVNEGLIVETPRYRALTELLEKMAAEGVDFVEIAGNDEILFTAISRSESHSLSFASLPRQGFDDHRHLILVKVDELAKNLRALSKKDAVLEHIHDY